MPDDPTPSAEELAMLTAEERALYDQCEFIERAYSLGKIGTTARMIRDLMRLRLAARPRPMETAPREMPASYPEIDDSMAVVDRCIAASVGPNALIPMLKITSMKRDFDEKGELAFFLPAFSVGVTIDQAAVDKIAAAGPVAISHFADFLFVAKFFRAYENMMEIGRREPADELEPAPGAKGEGGDA